MIWFFGYVEKDELTASSEAAALKLVSWGTATEIVRVPTVSPGTATLKLCQWIQIFNQDTVPTTSPETAAWEKKLISGYFLSR